jgi:hypothetical protein
MTTFTRTSIRLASRSGGWLYLLALAGEDGLHELRVRVQPGAQIAGHGIGVKGYAPLHGLGAVHRVVPGIVMVLQE